jgi:hypothetical protein
MLLMCKHEDLSWIGEMGPSHGFVALDLMFMVSMPGDVSKESSYKLGFYQNVYIYMCVCIYIYIHIYTCIYTYILSLSLICWILLAWVD